MMQKPLIIDTDIGDDIDDALALAYVLGRGELDLAGVTTVFRNTQLRARQARRLLELAGRPEIPVYAGVGKPYVQQTNLDAPICQYTPELAEDRYRPCNPDEGVRGDAAVDFLVQAARRYGERLSILLIGPLTNIARAIQADAAAMCSVGRYVMMGGCFYDQFLEWNILCDPEAARILLEAEFPLTCVGTDVTLRCTLTPQERDRLLAARSTPLSAYLSDILRLWLESSGREVPTLHDPLAAHALLDDSLLAYERQQARVELRGEFTRGMTVNFDRCFPGGAPGHPIRVAKTVNAPAFKQAFFDTLFAEFSVEVKERIV